MSSHFKSRSMPMVVALQLLVVLLAWSMGSASAAIAGPGRDAEAFVLAVAKINDAHLRQPGKNSEAQLAKQLPATAKSALKRVLEAKAGPELAPALLRCGAAALDLDLMEEFSAVRRRLAAV